MCACGGEKKGAGRWYVKTTCQLFLFASHAETEKCNDVFKGSESEFGNDEVMEDGNLYVRVVRTLNEDHHEALRTWLPELAKYVCQKLPHVEAITFSKTQDGRLAVDLSEWSKLEEFVEVIQLSV